jgi:hypothetical protein
MTKEQLGFIDITGSSQAKQLNTDPSRAVGWIGEARGWNVIVTNAPHAGTTTAWCENPYTVLASASGGDKWSRTICFYENAPRDVFRSNGR